MYNTMKRWYWWAIGIGILGIAAVLGIRAWQDPDFQADYVSEEQQEALAAGLTLQDVTLEQQDDDGQLLWRVKADEATYSPDRKTADLVGLTGELFQDGQLLYEVEADEGNVQQNGQVIFLQQNIVAVGIQNQMTLTGETLEWRPSEDVMIVRGQLTGRHPQVRAQAQEAYLYDREKRMVLNRDVQAVTVVAKPKVEPWLKLQGESLTWHWEAEELKSQLPLKIERFQKEQITDVLTGQQGLVELSQNRAVLTDDVQVRALQPPLQVESDRAIWQVDTQRITIDRPLKIVNTAENVTSTAQNGQLDLAKQVVYLSGDVQVSDQQNSSRLTANQLTWNLLDQTVLAEGAVNYQQGTPPLTVRGPRARGRIAEQTIIVDGGRVVTEIVPPSN